MSAYSEFIAALPVFAPPPRLTTERLIIRQWRDDDYAPFARLNADPEVMEFFPSPFSRETSDAMADKIRELIQKRGWGFWALELKSTGEFIGFTGLHTPDENLPCSPCVEVGWRLARKYWGQGLATEAARAARDFAFASLDLDEVYAFTPVQNQRSVAVMQRLGMTDTGRNFAHPQIPDGHHLKQHLLYRVGR